MLAPSSTTMRPLVHQLGALPCSMVNSLTRNTEEQCKFMIDNDCLEDEAAIDYVYLVFCEFSYDMRHLAVSLIAFLVVVLFMNLSAVADEFLCPSLLTVAKNLRMSDSLAGVTLLAFGNGCPDIFSSLAAASSGRPELIVGELLGAGIFCTSIVAGLIFINNDFKTARRPLLRDTSFYLLAVYLIWLYCRQGRVTFYGSIAFIVIYVIYLFIALSGQAIHARMRGEYPLADTGRQCQQPQRVSEPEKSQRLREAHQVHQDEKMRASCGANAATCKGDVQLAPAQQQQQQQQQQLVASNERADNYESWFAWRDESGRRRSSVKKEQIEQARLELQPPGERAPEPPNAIAAATMSQQVQAASQCGRRRDSGSAQVRRDSKAAGAASTLVELTRVTKVIGLCDAACELKAQDAELGRGPAKGPAPCEATGARARDSFTLAELDDFLFHINPINSIVWAESRLLVKLVSILRAPILLVTILTVPVVDHEKRNNNWCRLLNSIHCFMVPAAILMVARLGNDADDPPPAPFGGIGGGGLLAQIQRQAANYSLAATGGPVWQGAATTTTTISTSTATTHVILGARSHSPDLINASAAGPAAAAAAVATNEHAVASSLSRQLDDMAPLQLILLLAPGFLLGVFVFNTTQAHKAPKYHTVFAYFGFGMSVTWIYVLATEIVSLLKTVGIIFSMSDTAIGLSVLAWGNSLGDIVANLTLAEAGYARMALGASIGAPLLNLLLGFGLSFSYSLKPGGWARIEYGPAMTLLASTLTLVLLLLMASTLAPLGARSKKPLGYLLIACYGLYFALAVCLECGLL